MSRENKILRPLSGVENFFLIPGLDNFAASRIGLIYDIEKKKLAELYFSRSDRGNYYAYVRIIALPVHTLIAKTFLDDTCVTTGVKIANHLNGNTLDNRVDNLEWTNHSGNSLHAYKSGLRNENVRLLCKNIETNEVKKFFSYWDCARSFNINGSKVFHHINSKRKNKIFQDKYILIKDGEEWPDIDFENHDTYQGLPSSTVIINNVTNSCYIFDSLTLASLYLEMKPTTLMKKIRKMKSDNLKSITIEDYEVMLLKHAPEILKANAINLSNQYSKPSSPRNITSFVRKPKRVEVFNVKTKEHREWNSLEEFANSIGESKNTVQKHILTHNGMFRNNFQIQYLD